jgi:hypothetical protein
MNSAHPTDAVERTVDQEIRLVADAIEMVARGASPRVTVAGLRLGEAVLEPAQLLAASAGVRLVPRWNGDESGVDITVETPEA